MTRIQELLSANLLDDEAARTFHESHQRVVARHSDWRANFPAVGLLLDSDEDRAHALAGNYATEARETIGVWLSAQEAASPMELDDEARAAWIEEFWEAWQRQVFESEVFAALPPGPQHRFTTVFNELVERFRDEAMAFVRDGGARGKQAPSLGSRLFAPIAAIGRGLQAFFFPTVRR